MSITIGLDGVFRSRQHVRRFPEIVEFLHPAHRRLVGWGEFTNLNSQTSPYAASGGAGFCWGSLHSPTYELVTQRRL